MKDLATRHRLAINNAQFGVGFVAWLAKKIVAHARRTEVRDGVTPGHMELQFAQRGFAHVQFKLGVDGQLILAVVVREHFGNGQLGQDLVCLDPQSVISAGETIGKPLAAGHAQCRARRVVLGELFGRNLRQPVRLRDFEPHRAFIYDAQVAGEPRRAIGPQLYRIGGLWKRAQRRLHLNLECEGVLLRLVELHDETAVR